MSTAPSQADFLISGEVRPVSRVHVTFSLEGDAIYIRDGGETKGRTPNGTKLDGEDLPSSPQPIRFESERMLLLGTVFPLTIRHISGKAPAGPPTGSSINASLNRTIVLRTLTGALQFRPRDPGAVVQHALWMFTDATIGEAPDCAVVLPAIGLSESHARIHYWQDGFWMENLTADGLVRIGTRSVPQGQALPLRSGDLLTLGKVAFDLSVAM